MNGRCEREAATRHTVRTSTSSRTGRCRRLRADLPEVFPDFAPGNFTWDDELRGWVWTTFNEWQWTSPGRIRRSLVEYARIILRLANRGVDVFRPMRSPSCGSAWGTDRQGQPEVHAITQALKALTRLACPSVAFKAEAIVAPTKLLPYLGTGSHTGKVSDLAYHNSLMVQIWSMLASRDVRLAAHALGNLPPKPATATWLTYLRCHDDIGWAIMDEDAAALGFSGAAHRKFLAQWYAGEIPGHRRPAWSSSTTRDRRPADERDCRLPARPGGGRTPRG